MTKGKSNRFGDCQHRSGLFFSSINRAPPPFWKQQFLCSLCSLAGPSNDWAICFVSDSFKTASSVGWLVKKNIELLFPEFFAHMSLVFFSWCNFMSLLWSVLLSRKAPLSTVNTDLLRQNVRHIFNNTSLFHVTLTPDFRGQLLQKHEGLVTSPDVCLALEHPCWLARVPERCARRPPMLHIPVKTTMSDIHFNQDWTGSCVSSAGQRRANCKHDLSFTWIGAALWVKVSPWCKYLMAPDSV